MSENLELFDEEVKELEETRLGVENLSRLGGAFNGRVGDVKYSILEEAEFQKYNGYKWILMKGQALPANSKLARITGLQQLPDARGVFIRGMHVRRNDGKGDTDTSRTVGDYQDDSIQKHTHYINYAENNYPKGADLGCGDDGNRGSDGKCQSSGSEGKFSAETRPRNIVLYTYIKIN